MSTEESTFNPRIRLKDEWRKSLIDYPFGEIKDDSVRISYQSMQAPELMNIVEKFHVADFYNGETDFQKILALMDYVHGISCKDGNHTSPAIMNTDEIMKVAELGQLWCWDYATVLTEMLLSMGVKAVTVTCIPRLFDYDHHVGVMAYLSNSAKWVFLDPTFNTYFYGKEPMDIFEIRSAYAQGNAPKFRHITIQKNWKLILHNIEYDDYDSWYSDYMLKNMFRFILPKNSAYNCRTSNAETVFLLPNGYNTRNEYDDLKDSCYTFDIGCVLQS